MAADQAGKAGEDLLSRVADPHHLLAVFGHIYRHRRKFRPGVDGETLQQFTAQLDENIHKIGLRLRAGEYHFSPSLLYQLSLKGGERKTMARSTLRDTIVQKALSLIVEPAYEHLLPANCYAFRHRGGPQIGDALRYIVEQEGQEAAWKIKADIQDYFPSIKHSLLITQLQEIFPPPILDLYLRYLQAPWINDGQVLSPAQGLAVGSILANFLSNLYLRPLDLAMLARGVGYLRYCDDLLAFARDDKEAQGVLEMINSRVAERGLALNPEKSRIIPPGSHFVYLGYSFQDGKIRIGPRAIAKFKARLRRATPRRQSRIQRGQDGSNSLREIIGGANKEITGQTARNWIRYFAYCDSPEQLRGLDRWIRERVRAAATGRWNRGNYRTLPTSRLQELGLRSLVGEYYYWKHRPRGQRKGLLQAVGQGHYLESILETLRKRYWNPARGRYNFAPGSDGQSTEEFLALAREQLRQIQTELLDATYQFSPFIEFDKAKIGREDPRVICRSSFRDTLVQKAVAPLIERRFDRQLSDQAYAYRPGRNQHVAFGLVLRWIRSWPAYWVVKADFHSFLDTVNLGIISEALERIFVREPLLLDFYLKYVYNGRVREGVLLPRLVGLPRGGILTPFLANLYLKPLDEEMAKHSFHYLRYADDIFIYARSRQDAEEALSLLRNQATILKLELGSEKTYVVSPGGEYECLGYRIQGQEVLVRPNAVNRLKDRIRRLTSRRRLGLRQQDLATPAGQEAIKRLISKVRRAYIYAPDNDWPRHFCRATSDIQFRELDRWIADRVRAAATGRFSLRSRRTLPDATLRSLGLVSLISRFYYWKRRVWRQSRRGKLDKTHPRLLWGKEEGEALPPAERSEGSPDSDNLGRFCR